LKQNGAKLKMMGNCPRRQPIFSCAFDISIRTKSKIDKLIRIQRPAERLNDKRDSSRAVRNDKNSSRGSGIRRLSVQNDCNRSGAQSLAPQNRRRDAS
jgi:hypothetical protein